MLGGRRFGKPVRFLRKCNVTPAKPFLPRQLQRLAAVRDGLAMLARQGLAPRQGDETGDHPAGAVDRAPQFQ